MKISKTESKEVFLSRNAHPDRPNEPIYEIKEVRRSLSGPLISMEVYLTVEDLFRIVDEVHRLEGSNSPFSL